MFLTLKNPFTLCTYVRYEIMVISFFNNSELNDDNVDDTHSDSFRGKWN